MYSAFDQTLALSLGKPIKVSYTDWGKTVNHFHNIYVPDFPPGAA